MAKGIINKISDDDIQAVTDYWDTNHDNTVPTIMKALDLKESVVQSILRRHLADKFG
jgi:predicted transcriptional regulator